MKLPKKLRLAGHTWKVRVDKSRDLFEIGDCYGSTRLHYLTIDIGTDYAGDVVADTLLHEVLHALLIPHGLQKAEEERLVRYLAPMLLAAFRDNPKLAAVVSGW